jgi:hypothetical protein
MQLILFVHLCNLQSSNPHTYTFNQILDQFSSIRFFIYLCVVASLMALEYWVYQKCLRLKLVVKDLKYYPFWNRAYPISVACLTGTIGAQVGLECDVCVCVCVVLWINFLMTYLVEFLC